MQAFTYTYNDQTEIADYQHFTEGMRNRFRIYTLNETYVIAPVNYDNVKVIWLQSDGIPLPNDLIQSVGEGLENAGFY